MLFATIAVLIGTRKGLSPLRVLQVDLSQRSHLDLSPVDATIAPQEVRPVIHAINDLMARLSLALGVQNRFAADAAHQHANGRIVKPARGCATKISFGFASDSRGLRGHRFGLEGTVRDP